MPKHIIILWNWNTFAPDPEAWGSLTSLCKVHGLPYHYLKSKRFPIDYKGYRLDKVLYNHSKLD